MLGGDWTDGTMTDFKWRHFQGDVILWAVRWYCRYPISYRDLEEMLAERGISVDHTTIYRWVQCYAPEMEKRLRWFWRRGFDPSWRLDETYVKVRGKWTYLYRAGHCCKVSDEAAFCLIQRPYISKTLLTRRISPRGSP